VFRLDQMSLMGTGGLDLLRREIKENNDSALVRESNFHKRWEISYLNCSNFITLWVGIFSLCLFVEQI
jgi:hypothetical protein